MHCLDEPICHLIGQREEVFPNRLPPGGAPPPMVTVKLHRVEELLQGSPRVHDPSAVDGDGGEGDAVDRAQLSVSYDGEVPSLLEGPGNQVEGQSVGHYNGAEPEGPLCQAATEGLGGQEVAQAVDGALTEIFPNSVLQAENQGRPSCFSRNHGC